MRIKIVSLTAIALLGILLAGCRTDRGVEVANGEYVPVCGAGASGVAPEIERARIDRENQTAWFMLVDGSQVIVPFASRPRSEWPAGCPANVQSTRMEVLDLATDALTFGSTTFFHPVLVRDCPPDPEEIVLRSDGRIGGGGTACAGAAQCVTFEAVSAATSLPHSGKGYELYSWYAEQEGTWIYTLVTGTNRMKSYAELSTSKSTITGDGWVKITVRGTGALKSVLNALPEDEMLVWLDAGQLEGAPAMGATFPDRQVVQEIERHCSCQMDVHYGDPAATSARSSGTPTFGPTPTATPEPTTLPDATPTDTPRPLPTATATRAPVHTTTPTPTPTDTPRPLPTSTATRIPVHTTAPTPTPTAVSPQILSFIASPDPVERGGTVTLNWDAPGTVGGSITRLSEQGGIFLEIEALDLPTKGSITVQVPESYVESVKYYLGARDVTGVLYKAYVTVSIICRYDEHIAPCCPLTRDHVWSAYEPFERGHMVWRGDTREIYVLYNDGRYESYEDTWQEGDPVDIQGSPPPGLLAPVRGFGNLYASQPLVREKLGWATAAEVGYTMTVETRPGGSGRYPGISIYFTLPDSRVVNLYPFSSTWQLLPLAEIIIDNQDPAMQLHGIWSLVDAPHSYGQTCAWAPQSPLVPNESGYRQYDGASIAYAYVRPELPQRGEYQVYAWWCDAPVEQRARNLEIQIHPTTGFIAYQSVRVDTTSATGRWNSLGTYLMEPDGFIVVTNLAGSTDGVVVLDAFRFVHRSPPS